MAPIVSLLLQNSILLARTGFTHALSSIIASSISSKVFSCTSLDLIDTHQLHARKGDKYIQTPLVGTYLETPRRYMFSYFHKILTLQGGLPPVLGEEEPDLIEV